MQISRRTVALFVGVAALLMAMAAFLPLSVANRLTESTLYQTMGAATLALVFLTIGWGIDLQEARKHLRLVLLVVLLGVPAKFGITWLLVELMGQSITPETIMAVVQVEATSALLIAANRWMSKAARTSMALIAMWDDPGTAFAVEIMQGSGSGEVFGAMAPYLVLIGVVMLFFVIRWVNPTGTAAMVQRGKEATIKVSEGIVRFRLLTRDVQLTMLVIAVIVLAVSNDWFTLAAIAGLVLRPSWVRSGVTKADRAALSANPDADVRTWEAFTRNALIVVAFVQMGPYLTGGTKILDGAALAVAVVVSHAAVILSAITLYRKFSEAGKREFTKVDMAFMAVCQLNGLTAVSLGNGLGAAAAQVIVVALIVVGVLYVAGNLAVLGLAPPSAGGKPPLRLWMESPERWWREKPPMQFSALLPSYA